MKFMNKNSKQLKKGKQRGLAPKQTCLLYMLIDSYIIFLRRIRMQEVYPVLFTTTEECILVEVPDLEVLTEGKNMFDAVKMARDAIQLKLVVLEDEKAKISIAGGEKNVGNNTSTVTLLDEITEVNILIEAEDGTTKTYTLIINALPDNVNLLSVKVEGNTAHTDKEIKKIFCGIDMQTAELILADRLNEKNANIDLVITHHPNGYAYAKFYEVIGMQTDKNALNGVAVNVAEALTNKRISAVEKSVSPSNHNRDSMAAKLLNLNYMCMHTVADNHVETFLTNLIKNKNPYKLSDILDSRLFALSIIFNTISFSVSFKLCSISLPLNRTKKELRL